MLLTKGILAELVVPVHPFAVDLVHHAKLPKRPY